MPSCSNHSNQFAENVHPSATGNYVASTPSQSRHDGLPDNREFVAGNHSNLWLSAGFRRKYAARTAFVAVAAFMILQLLCIYVPGFASARWQAAKDVAITKIWAGLGSVRDQYDLACFYESGYGVEKDERQAIRWFTKAAENGYTLAQCDLAGGYARRFAKRDVNEAIHWWQEAAMRGNVAAQYNLGWYLCDLARQGVEIDFDDVEKWWTMAAEGGSAEAQYSKFEFIIQGGGTGWDKALPWLRKSAEQGFGCAQYEMGHAYEYGLGVERDVDEANGWYRLARKNFQEQASCSNDEVRSRGLFCLAYMWEHEDAAHNCQESYASRKTFELYREAALLGNSHAQYKLGTCYSNRIGVDRNLDEALFWWKKAAEQGHEMAAVALVQYYSEPMGNGAVRDKKEVEKWAKYSNGSKYMLAHFAQIGWRGYLLPF